MSIELDQCCFNIGAAYRSAHGKGEKSRPGVRAYYATELYKTGGHTRLIEELIAARPDDEHHVICAAVPDLDAGWGLNLIFRPVVPATIHIVSLDLNKRLADAMGILAKVRPETLFHLAHSDDPVGTALLQPNNANRFVLVHHNDHSFSLGPSRPELVHITVHPRSKRDVEKLIGRDTVYIPMTSSDGPSVRWQPGEPLLTVTSGSQNKFSSHDGRRYIDLLRVRLIGREGQHIHIGPLDPQFYTTLKGELDLQGVGGRLIHVAFVESLSDALRKLRPHLYLNSYPIGGGHALVDAMAVGLPIAAGCYNSNFDSSEIPYRGHLSWKHLGELQLALQRFTEDERERQQNLALEHFNGVHAPNLFKDRVRELMSRMSFEEKYTQ